MSNALKYIKGSRTRVLNTLPSKDFGNEGDFVIKTIKTSGDIHSDIKLSEIGGKNLFCKEIEENLIENNIDTVFQLGDLFDRRKYINFNSLYLCRKYFFDKLRDNNIKMYTLLGNHDISYKNTLKVNSSELLLILE